MGYTRKFLFAPLYVTASLSANTMVSLIFKYHEFRDKIYVFDKKSVLSFCIKHSSETSVFPVAIY